MAPLKTRIVRAADALLGTGLYDELDRAQRRAAQLRSGTRLRAAAVRQARGFHAAIINRLNSDWDGTLIDVDSELKASLSRLRGRSRTLKNNNAHVESFCNLMKTNVVGPEGPTLHAEVRDPAGILMEDVNKRLQDGWWKYITKPVTTDGDLNFIELDHVLIENTAIDGEQFVRKVLGPRFRHGLGLQVIDADLVDEGLNRMAGRDGPEVRMGIERDAIGARLGYLVYRRHPDTGAIDRVPERIPAEFMRHLYRARRANQSRGYTWLASVMSMLQMHGGTLEAIMAAWRAGASQMMFIEQSGDTIPGEMSQDEVAGEDGTVDAGSGVPTQQRSELIVEPGTAVRLYPGETIAEWKPTQPSGEMSDADTLFMRIVAVGMGVSYHELTNNLKDVNMSSIRIGRLQAIAFYRMIQRWWTWRWWDWVYESWVETAILSGAVDVGSADWELFTEHTFQPHGFQLTDMWKEVQAYCEGLESGIFTLTEIINDRGKDFADHVETLKAEREALRDAGVVLISKRQAAMPPAPEREDPDEEE